MQIRRRAIRGRAWPRGKIDKIHSSSYQVRGRFTAIDRSRRCSNAARTRSRDAVRRDATIPPPYDTLYNLRGARRFRRACMRLCHGLSPPFPCATSISFVPVRRGGSHEILATPPTMRRNSRRTSRLFPSPGPDPRCIRDVSAGWLESFVFRDSLRYERCWLVAGDLYGKIAATPSSDENLLSFDGTWRPVAGSDF